MQKKRRKGEDSRPSSAWNSYLTRTKRFHLSTCPVLASSTAAQIVAFFVILDARNRRLCKRCTAVRAISQPCSSTAPCKGATPPTIHLDSHFASKLWTATPAPTAAHQATLAAAFSNEPCGPPPRSRGTTIYLSQTPVNLKFILEILLTPHVRATITPPKPTLFSPER